MTDISTTRAYRFDTGDWRVEVVGLAEREAFAISGFVAQLIIARGDPFTKGDYFSADRYVEVEVEVSQPFENVQAKAPVPASPPPLPRDRFSGLDLEKPNDQT